MDVREWLEGGLPDLEAQRDEAFANAYQAIGAIRTVKATIAWLDREGRESAPPTNEPDEGIDDAEAG